MFSVKRCLFQLSDILVDAQIFVFHQYSQLHVFHVFAVLTMFVIRH